MTRHGITRTRFRELGVRRVDARTWRFVSTDGDSDVGPEFRTKAEALAALEDYAAEYGCEGATPSRARVLVATIARMTEPGTDPADDADTLRRLILAARAIVGYQPEDCPR